jgi:hypothetical protein
VQGSAAVTLVLPAGAVAAAVHYVHNGLCMNQPVTGLLSVSSRPGVPLLGYRTVQRWQVGRRRTGLDCAL